MCKIKLLVSYDDVKNLVLDKVIFRVFNKIKKSPFMYFISLTYSIHIKKLLNFKSSNGLYLELYFNSKFT